MSDQTPVSSGESMLLAAQALPTSSPINVSSSASSVVPAPTASQFSRDLEVIQVAEALVGTREGPNTTQRSHTLDTILETQDLDEDLDSVSVGVGHLLYDEMVDPNATTLPVHSTPGIDSPAVGIPTTGTEYISPVFGIPPQSTSGWDHTHTHTHTHTCLLYTSPSPRD